MSSETRNGGETDDVCAGCGDGEWLRLIGKRCCARHGVRYVFDVGATGIGRDLDAVIEVAILRIPPGSQKGERIVRRPD